MRAFTSAIAYRLCAFPNGHRLRAACLTVLAALGILVGCVDVALPELNVPVDLTLFGDGPSFVVRGTAALADRNGPCLSWFGESGLTYHLSQSPRLENDLFDRVSAPGTTSRLVLVERPDIELACAFGRIVEVTDVLEIVEAESAKSVQR